VARRFLYVPIQEKVGTANTARGTAMSAKDNPQCSWRRTSHV